MFQAGDFWTSLKLPQLEWFFICSTCSFMQNSALKTFLFIQRMDKKPKGTEKKSVHVFQIKEALGFLQFLQIYCVCLLISWNYRVRDLNFSFILVLNSVIKCYCCPNYLHTLSGSLECRALNSKHRALIRKKQHAANNHLPL